MAETFIQGNFKFEVIDEKKKSVRIMRKDINTDFNGKLIIPSSVTENGKKYTVIEIGGFVGEERLYDKVEDKRSRTGYRMEKGRCVKRYGFGSTQITEVVIPETIETISTDCFLNCSKLAKVIIPKNVKKLDRKAFEKCLEEERKKMEASK